MKTERLAPSPRPCWINSLANQGGIPSNKCEKDLELFGKLLGHILTMNSEAVDLRRCRQTALVLLSTEIFHASSCLQERKQAI
jgi:hypothetical protein